MPTVPSTGSSISATRTTCTVTVKDKKVITLTNLSTPLKKGDQVTIRLRNPLFFDSAGNRIQGG